MKNLHVLKVMDSATDPDTDISQPYITLFFKDMNDLIEAERLIIIFDNKWYECYEEDKSLYEDNFYTGQYKDDLIRYIEKSNIKNIKNISYTESTVFVR